MNATKIRALIVNTLKDLTIKYLAKAGEKSFEAGIEKSRLFLKIEDEKKTHLGEIDLESMTFKFNNTLGVIDFEIVESKNTTTYEIRIVVEKEGQ